MRKLFFLLGLVCVFQIFPNVKMAPAAQYCAYHGGLGLSRIISINPTGGPQFGRIQYQQTIDLRPKEVILTFDDGPYPALTDKILKTLDKYCVKATFFPVGQMAKAYPAILRRVSQAGHTIGAHTHSHPLNLRKHSYHTAVDQIERGFMQIQTSLKHPVAPFFRFPGLNDSKQLNRYLTETQHCQYFC